MDQDAAVDQDAEEVELFANGMLQYPTIDESSLESEVTVVHTNQVEFNTSDTIEAVFDYYYRAMERDRLTPSSVSIVGEPEANRGGMNGGANVGARSRSGNTEVSILIFDGAENANPASNFTDGVPRYPAIADEDVTTEKAGDGRRDVLTFVTQDSPADILNFYRDAFERGNMEITSMQTQMDGETSQEYGSVYIRNQIGGDGTRVTLQTKGDRWEIAMPE